MPQSKNTFYDFHASYDKEWEAFIAQFPEDDQLEKGSVAKAIKRSCEELHRLIEILYTKSPEYGTQNEIRWEWEGLISILEEEETAYNKLVHPWFIQQVINMINSNNPRVVYAIWYALGVDYFECGPHGSWMLPLLYDQLQEKDIEQLINYSRCIPWVGGKVETYRTMVRNKHHHELLANALYRSCDALCHTSAKASEALEILEQLDIPKELYKKTFALLTTPVSVTIVESVVLPEPTDDGITGFLSITHHNIPTWFPYAELWIDGVCLGRFTENYHQVRWQGSTSISTTYQVTTPKEQGSQEHILYVTATPFQKEWKGKTALLKPL